MSHSHINLYSHACTHARTRAHTHTHICLTAFFPGQPG